MRTYDSSIHANSRRGRIAPALMAALVVALLIGVGLWGGVRVLATGDGTVSGTATVVIGSPLSCTLAGALTGSSVLDEVGGVDIAFVTDSLSGGGECTGNPPFDMTGSIIGEIEEQKNNDPGVLEFPADGTFEVLLAIDSDALGQIIHNKVSEPALMECPNITNGDLFPCSLVSAMTVDLYNAAEDTVLGTITAVDLDFEGLKLAVGGLTELPEVEDTSLQSGDSSGTSKGVVAGIAAGATAGVVVLGGGAWYTRKLWLRRWR